MEQHEYVGELRSDGALAIHGQLRDRFAVGEKIRVILEPIEKRDRQPLRQLDSATQSLLKAIDEAQDIGASDDHEKLRHSTLFEERMEGKIS